MYAARISDAAITASLSTRIRASGSPARETARVPQSQSKRDITELPRPVGLGPETAAGDAVMKPGRHFIDPVTLAEDIDDQRGFHAPAPGQRLHRIESLPGDAAHPRKRLAGRNPVRYATPDLASQTTRP